MRRYIKSDIDPKLKSNVKDIVRQELENIELPEHCLFDSFGDEIRVYVDHPYVSSNPVKNKDFSRNIDAVEISFWIEYDEPDISNYVMDVEVNFKVNISDLDSPAFSSLIRKQVDKGLTRLDRKVATNEKNKRGEGSWKGFQSAYVREAFDLGKNPIEDRTNLGTILLDKYILPIEDSLNLATEEDSGYYIWYDDAGESADRDKSDYESDIANMVEKSASPKVFQDKYTRYLKKLFKTRR